MAERPNDPFDRLVDNVLEMAAKLGLPVSESKRGVLVHLMVFGVAFATAMVLWTVGMAVAAQI